MAGRPAQPVGGGRAGEDQVDRGQRDVDRGASGDVRAGHQRRGRVEAPEAGPPAGVDRLADERGDGVGRHALEHRPVRIRVGGQERAVESLRPELRPGDLEEPDEARVVDGGDRGLAVLGRRDQREPAVGLERRRGSARPARRPRWPGPACP